MLGSDGGNNGMRNLAGASSQFSRNRSRGMSVLSGASTDMMREQSVRSYSIADMSTKEETNLSNAIQRPRSFINLVSEIISYITFERIIIAMLFTVMIFMTFVSIRQQFVINAMSEELASPKALVATNKLDSSSDQSIQNSEDPNQINPDMNAQN